MWIIPRRQMKDENFLITYLRQIIFVVFSQIHIKMFKDYSALLIYTGTTTVGLPPSQEITRHFMRLEHHDLIEEKRLCI